MGASFAGGLEEGSCHVGGGQQSEEYGRPLAGSQQENRALHTTAERNWILPTICVRKRCPQAPEKNTIQLAAWFQPLRPWAEDSDKHILDPAPWKWPDNKRMLFWATKFVVMCSTATKKIQIWSYFLTLTHFLKTNLGFTSFMELFLTTLFLFSEIQLITLLFGLLFHDVNNSHLMHVNFVFLEILSFIYSFIWYMLFGSHLL